MTLLEDEIARVFRAQMRMDSDLMIELDPVPDSPILPRIVDVTGVLIQDEDTAVFFLETESGEKLKLPVEGRQLPVLAELVRHVLQAAPEAGPIAAPPPEHFLKALPLGTLRRRSA